MLQWKLKRKQVAIIKCKFCRVMKRKGFFPPIMTSSSTISNSESISLQLDEHRSVIDSSSGSSVLLKLSLDSFAPLFGDESLDSSSSHVISLHWCLQWNQCCYQLQIYIMKYHTHTRILVATSFARASQIVCWVPDPLAIKESGLLVWTYMIR